MKTKALALAALLLPFVVSAHAQTITTFETFSDWSGSNYTFTANRVYAQTFTSVSEIYSMAYKFSTTNTLGGTGLALTAKLVEWNPLASTAAAAIGTTVLDLGTINIAAPNTWTETLSPGVVGYDVNLILNQSGLNSSKTYALMLVSSTGSGSTGIGLTFTNDDSFAFGVATRQTNATAINQDLGFDWGFTQTIVTVVPESSTVAALAGAVLVAGLVALRLRQRRQQTLVPVTTA